MGYIDSHCHLEQEYYGDQEHVDEVVARAWAAGLTSLVTVGASGITAGAVEAVALAERHAAVYATVAIHPHEAHKYTEEALEEIARFLEHPKVVALGEIGLDYYYDFSPAEVQRTLCQKQLAMAKEANIPAMFHVRDAHDDLCQIIDEVGLPRRGAVVHCFSAGPDEARMYLERGIYLSIPGIATFPKGQSVRDAIAIAPLDRLLIETDSPYLAPVPHRGKQNEPAFVVETAKAVAAVKGCSDEEVGKMTSANAIALFGLNNPAS